jgi:alpha-1,3-glucosyltransferase
MPLFSWLQKLNEYSGSFINPVWFALFESRRLDDPVLKVYMRATAFISEYLVYIPAAIICLRRYARLQHINSLEASIALVALLMQPATILIDHGHFQYNTVMLGLLLASMSSMLAERPLWACMFFVGSLGFKQMALFYAPAVFVYLLGICFNPRVDIGRLFTITLATVVSFAILYAPFIGGIVYDQYRGESVKDFPLPPLLASLPIALNEEAWYFPLLLQLAQSVHRIFPFARGLFEDKVANFWCALHTFHKLHRYSSVFVQRAALLATLVAITPPCLILLLKPKKHLLPFGLAATSWAFFLFSFQVHEKNVLLPLLPMTVLLGGQGGLLPATRAWVGLANMLGVWTMFPLLKRDDLRVPYFVLSLLWAYLLGLPPVSLSAYKSTIPGELNILTRLIHLTVYVAMVAWHIGEAFLLPPENKPDLWVVANVLVGAPSFGLCYLWCLWRLVVESEIFATVRQDWQSAQMDKKKA